MTEKVEQPRKPSLKEIILKDWITAIIAIGGVFLSAYLINDYYWKAQKDYEWARSDRQRKLELWAETSELASTLMLTLNRQADLQEQLQNLSQKTAVTAVEWIRLEQRVKEFESEAGKRKEVGGKLAGRLRLVKAYFGKETADRVDDWRTTFNRIPSTQILRLTPESDFVKQTLGLLAAMEREIRGELNQAEKERLK